jgi:hypothetical protein
MANMPIGGEADRLKPSVLCNWRIIVNHKLAVVERADLLVVGGSAGAVACALACQKQGRSVYLVAPASYLGDDIASRFDYWLREEDELPTELARQLFPAGADPSATPPTPMHIKRTLEQAMVEAEVSFLLNARPAGVLRDSTGRISGAVIASRSGRHAIVAGQVVDATDFGMLSHQSGASFTSDVRGSQQATHVTIGGESIADDDLQVEALSSMVAQCGDNAVELPARRYTLTVDVGNGDWAGFSTAYAEVASRCWRPGVFQHNERLTLLKTDRLDGDPRSTEWDNNSAFPLEALRVEDGLHILGSSACVSPEVSQRLARPVNLMGIGERLGAALTEHETMATTGELTASCANSELISKGKIRSHAGGLRPWQEPDETVGEAANSIPIVGRYDVVIIGGGTGGAPAAVSAARAGASTLVCETQYGLGGVGTLGQIANYYYGNIVGFTQQVDEGVVKLEHDPKVAEKQTGWSPQAKQTWYLREAREAGAQVWFGTLCCGAWVEGDRVRGVMIAGPHGYGLIEASAVVDSSGNADVAAAAGADTTGIEDDHVAVQGTGLASVRPDKRYHNTDHSFSDDTDVVDATSFLVLAKEKFRNDFDAGQLVDSRERRQIIGDIELGPADFLTDRRFPDTICVSSSNFDSHGYTIHPLFLVKSPDKERMWVQVPYRCLLPRGLDGILVTGLGVCAHRDALPVIRMQPDVQNQGYAAGHAAAMAAKAGIGVREVDLKELQQHLVETGNLPETVLTDEDTFPVSDEKLQWAVNEGWETHEGIAICFAESERANPLLREAHDVCPDNKWLYALALGLMGDNHGAATLRDELNGREWDDGWNYKGMGQFGMSSSHVDAMLIALGRCDGESAWPVILKKIADLQGMPDFSHCRAIAEACEGLYEGHPNDEIASALASLFKREGIGGHSHTSIAEAREALTDDSNENDVRNNALRELHLARALYRCGDLDSLGEQTLRRYADDIRGHFARHARAVLARE